MPGPMGGRPPRGAKPTVANPGKVFKRIIGFVAKNYLLQCIVVLVCIVLTVFSTIQGTMFTKTLIDQYIMPLMQQTVPDYTQLLHAIIRVACFYAVGVIAAYVNTRMMVYVTQGTMRSLRDEIFVHMESLPIKYFDTHAHGDIMSIYTNDVDTLRQMISQSIPQLINSSITIIGVLASMIILNIPLTLLTLVLVGLMLVVTKKATGMSGKYFVKQQKNLGEVNGFIEEMMGGQKVVKVFCHEEENMERFDKINEELCDSSYNANKFANILGPINAQIGNISYVIIAIAGGALALGGVGGFTLGGLASFLTFNKSLNMPINQVSMQFNSIIMALAGGERIFRLLDETPEVDDGYVTLVNAVKDGGTIKESEKRTGMWAWKHYHKDTGITDYKELKGDVVFDDVDFGYNPDKIIINDFSADVKDGQKIAIVGPTGAGKTTMVKLLMRFYDLNGGSIKVDGYDIKDFNRSSLREMFGMVLQDTWLFSGTIMENIRYGRLDATDEEVIAAAKAAHVHNFIMQQPGGYDMVLDEETSNISQGQKQLLTIARAILANNKILILDEATSSVDTRTEVRIQKAMDNLMKGRTSFVIAHRLSTIKDADLILVMKDGDIIEQGNHEELLSKKGFYADLYNSQFENKATA
mgnify:CR=1 FL=1